MTITFFKFQSQFLLVQKTKNETLHSSELTSYKILSLSQLVKKFPHPSKLLLLLRLLPTVQQFLSKSLQWGPGGYQTQSILRTEFRFSTLLHFYNHSSCHLVEGMGCTCKNLNLFFLYNERLICFWWNYQVDHGLFLKEGGCPGCKSPGSLGGRDASSTLCAGW